MWGEFRRRCGRVSEQLSAGPGADVGESVPAQPLSVACRMRVDQTFDLKDVAHAFNVSAAGHVVGKLAIAIAAARS